MPSLNTKNAILSNAILVDSSYNVGIGGASSAGIPLKNTKKLTGASNTFANYADGQIQTDATGLSHYFYSEANIIANAAPTGIYHFKASQGTFGSGSSLTVQAGLVIDVSLSGAGTNYGIISNITAADNNWNLYIGGSAKNWIASSLGIGAGAVNPTATLDVNGTLKASGAATFSSSVGANGVMSLGNDGTYGSTYKTLGLTGNTNGTHRIFAGTSDDLYITSATSRGINFWTDGSSALKMTITSGGNVGIGTSSPDIFGRGDAMNVGISATGASDNMSLQLNAGASGGRGAQIYMGQGGTRHFTISSNSSESTLGTTSNTPLKFTTNDTEKMRITSGGWSKFSNTGTYASPNGTFHQFNSDDVDDVTLQVYASSISKTGNTFEAVCARSSSNLFNLIAAYSVTTLQFAIRGDGLIVGPGLISTHTVGSAANMYVDPSNGAIYRSTSSLKYKKNVKDYSKGLDIVMQLRPVTYEGKNEIDAGKQFAGLIAEEVHDLGLTEFVQYAKDGTPDALAYSHMIAILTKAIQELKTQNDDLQSQINELKAQ
jgi:hypothetical protein